MPISIGDALLTLGVDTKDLDKGLQGIKGTIQKHSKAIGLAMTAAGGAILAAGALSIKTYVEMGDEVQKMALRTGFSTEALSELRHAAEISGADLSTLEKAVKRMSGTILDAQDGLETYVRAFRHIGIEVKELDGLNPEQQFLKIAEAISELEDPTMRAAIAQDIFGRAGTSLLPLFAAGKQGLADLRQEAHNLGIVFDQEAANKAARMQDAMTRLKESVSGVKMVIAEQLIPALMPLIEKVKEIISGISTWMKEHPELTKAITLTIGALGALMVVLGPLLIALPQLTAAYGILKTFMLTKLIPSIIATTAALWAKVSALLAVLAAAGPAGWVVLAASIALIGTVAVAAVLKIRDALKQTEVQQEDLTDSVKETGKELTAVESVTKSYGATAGIALQNAIDKQRILNQEIGREIALRQEDLKILGRLFPTGIPTEQVMAVARAAGYEPTPEELRRIAAGEATRERLIREYKELHGWEPVPSELRRIIAEEAAREQTRALMEYLQTYFPGGLTPFPHGGIAMRPMLASVAEKKPEAIMPLDRLESILGAGGYQTANIQIFLDGREIGRAVGQPLVDTIRVKTGLKI